MKPPINITAAEYRYYCKNGGWPPSVHERMKAEAPKKNKYGAIPTELDGHKFPSKLEANRYAFLKQAEAAGLISNLELQPKYPMTINGQKCGNAIMDFRYTTRKGREVVEDAKGKDNQLSKLKRKITAALYGIEVEIVTKPGEPIKYL